MKSTALITGIAILAAIFSVAANAQTGRPSTEEAPTARVTTTEDSSQVGSYARYLMLNGVRRDEAIKEAANYDHPATRPLLARYAHADGAAKAKVQQ